MSAIACYRQLAEAVLINQFRKPFTTESQAPLVGFLPRTLREKHDAGNNKSQQAMQQMPPLRLFYPRPQRPFTTSGAWGKLVATANGLLGAGFGGCVRIIPHLVNRVVSLK